MGEKRKIRIGMCFRKRKRSNLRLFHKRGGGFPNFHHLKDLFSWNPRLRKAPPKKRKELLLFEVEGSQAQPPNPPTPRDIARNDQAGMPRANPKNASPDDVRIPIKRDETFSPFFLCLNSGRTLISLFLVGGCL